MQVGTTNKCFVLQSMAITAQKLEAAVAGGEKLEGVDPEGAAHYKALLLEHPECIQ